MGPTSRFRHRPVLVQVVVDAVGVGHEDSLVLLEHRVHRRAVVLRCVAEEHVPRRRDDHPEVPPAAFLLVANEHPRRVRAQIRSDGERVFPHRVDQRLAQPSHRLVPGAHRRLREFESFPCVDLLQSMERRVIGESSDDRLGEQAGPSETTLDGKRDGLGNAEVRGLQPVALLEQKLRAMDFAHHERRRPTLDGRDDLFSDAVEVLEPLLDDVVWDELDLHNGQVLGHAPATGRLAPRLLGFGLQLGLCA